MSLIASLSLLLIGAHLLGRIAERLGQPALLGQMLAGIALGPSLLEWVRASAPLAALVDLAVLFVVVTAGLEMRMQHVLEAFRGKGSFALLLGFMAPAAAAGLFAFAMDLTPMHALVVVLCLSVTALPVALRILGSFGLLQTPLARIAISSALLSDVIVLLALGVAMSVAAPTDGSAAASLPTTVGVAVLKLGVLFLVVAACHHACSWMAARKMWSAAPSQRSADAVLIVTLLFMLALGAVSELLGFHFVIGVFLAALMVTRDLISDARFESLERTCELMTTSLFGPLFLAYQGVLFELQALNDYALVAGLLIVAIISKIAGGYATARLCSLAPRDSLGVGVVMNARGVVGMVVASIAYQAGLVDQALFSALLLVCIVTSVMTPVLLKVVLKPVLKTSPTQP